MTVHTLEHEQHRLAAMRTPEYRQKMSDSVKARYQDNEYRERMGKVIKIGLNKPEAKKRHSEGLKKYYSNPENRKLMSDSCRKAPHTPEWNKRVSDSLKGRVFTKEHLKHIGESHSGEKNYGWLGGISFLPYSYKFNKKLKESIKARDKYRCRLCNASTKLYVHHIDYDKKNTEPSNLISLCLSCHMRTNYNRNCWIEYLRYKNHAYLTTTPTAI